MKWILLLSALMSGFATPVEKMPVVLQWLAQAIPLTHFLEIVHGSVLRATPAAICSTACGRWR